MLELGGTTSDLGVVVAISAKQAHERATRTQLAQVASDLEAELGQALVAFMTGVSDRKTVGRWARGERRPRREAEERLRCAYQVWQILRADEDADTTRSWFFGMNPELDDEAPARAIARGDFRGAIAAARDFGRL